MVSLLLCVAAWVPEPWQEPHNRHLSGQASLLGAIVTRIDTDNVSLTVLFPLVMMPPEFILVREIQSWKAEMADILRNLSRRTASS